MQKETKHTHTNNETLDLLFAVMKRVRGQTSLHQMKALLFVTEHEDPSMKAFADYFGITPPSATSMVNRLVKEGKLHRHVDEKDRRAVRISITPSGKKELEASIKAMSEEMNMILSVLSKEEKTAFTTILKKLTAPN